MTSTKPRRVDFLNQRDDLQVLILGQLGFSTEFICQQTGLSEGQVIYRLHKGNTRRLDYRNGQSNSVVLVLSAVETKIARDIRSQLK